MNDFIWPVIGGVLIGLSATFLLMLNGKIAGISGIAWGTLSRESAGDRGWRFMFIIGMLGGALLFHWLTGVANPAVNSNYLLAGLAGLLVGAGVKVANGCTSGHGVCGIGRLSSRSLVATAVFMSTAIVTVAVYNALVA